MNRKDVASLLALFLGFLGIDRFYLGEIKYGIIILILSLLTCGILGTISGALNFIRLNLMDLDEFNEYYK